ncbi:MAG: 2-aminoethylphosphonate--pyruvate transaminase [Alphaproteobacteria bacterium]
MTGENFANDETPLLLTPGPLTTSRRTRNAMLRDWGSRDTDFIALTGRIREMVTALCDGEPSHTCVPIQGSGTFAVEAMLGTMIPPDGGVLIAVNGAYGRRMAEIVRKLGRHAAIVEGPEDAPMDVAALERSLAETSGLTHLAVVHCETTSGILNSIEKVAACATDHGLALLIDAMSSFGALPLRCRSLGAQAIAASANKCLEGVPGVGLVIADKAALAATAGNAPSLSLDLHDQWRGFESNGQWRFTPPTHVLAALGAALEQLIEEGGPPARLARYSDNCRRLIAGMEALGFRLFLAQEDQAPIIVTFHIPTDKSFVFKDFYQQLHNRGVVIYPGKVTGAETFRIGCIGAIDGHDIDRALKAVGEVCGPLSRR